MCNLFGHEWKSVNHVCHVKDRIGVKGRKSRTQKALGYKKKIYLLRYIIHLKSNLTNDHHNTCKK